MITLRAREAAAVVHLADEVLDHLLGDFEVGDHAVAQRPDRLDVAGRAADHLLGLFADGEDLLAPAIDGDRHHRGLVQHDPLALDVHQRVGGAEVDRHVGGQQAKNLENMCTGSAAKGPDPARRGRSTPPVV